MKKSLLMKSLLLLFALVVGTGSSWADTAKLTNAEIVAAGNAASGYNAYAITGGGGKTWNVYAIKNKHSNATADKHFLQIKKYSNPTAYYIQVPAYGTKITSIEMTVSNTNKAMDGGGNSATLYFSSSSSTDAAGTGVVSGTGASSVTIDCSSLNVNTGYITASGSVRIWDVKVTYTTSSGPEATLSTTSLDFGEVTYGQSKNMTFTVTPANLTGDLTIASNNAKYTVTPTSIAQATTAATTITVTAAPTAANDNMDGAITISGGGITQKTVTLTTTVVKPSAELAFAVPSYKVVKDLDNFPTPTLTNPHNVVVTYSSSDEDVAAVVYNTTGELLIGSKVGTTTITATFAGNADYAAGSATYTITTFDTKGTEANPYNVTEALVKINEIGNTNSEKVYVRGIVCTAPTSVSSGKATYFISVDGNATNTIQVYKGLGLGGANFSAASDLAVGDEVLIAGTLIKYNNTTPEINQGSSIINLKHGSAAEVKSISVTADKYNTFVATENLIVPTGVTAYIATGESETTLTLKSVAKIKAGTPVILYADVTAKTRYQFEVTTDEVTYSSANLLKISNGTTINGVFVLAKNGSDVGFYKWAGGALSPGKVYVDAPANPAREFLGFAFEDEDVTGINEAKGEKKAVEGIFDLQGRKVVTPSKGLYIVNGKKVIIK